MSNKYLLINSKGVTVNEFEAECYTVDCILDYLITNGKLADYDLIEPDGNCIHLSRQELKQLWDEANRMDGNEAEMEEAYLSQFDSDSDLGGIY